MNEITNPILKGFHPDPSLCRVGEDYYIATSTFQWYPGVRISHSRDLVHWEHAAYALTRESQLDMRGTPDSTGVWAPCLSWCDGQFYLIYSNLKNRFHSMDVCNYLVTAPSVEGPWSEPVFLNRSGFDPSLFHDTDGRKWLLNMRWTPQPAENSFSGILLQEYDPAQKKLVGPCENIFRGTPIGLTEGPHLYRRNGYYYLMTAEGGTGYAHAVTLARSRTLEGPYEVCPHNPVLTAAGSDLEGLQKAGHGSLVETLEGEWYLAHLCGRPVHGTDRCTLGRETALQKVEWREDGWLYLFGSGQLPLTKVQAPVGTVGSTNPLISQRDEFDTPVLSPDWNTLRQPFHESRQSLSARPGWLRIYGGTSLNCAFDQSMVARRVQSFHYTVQTCLDFSPESILQSAGLVCYYDLRNYVYLRITWNEEKKCRCIGVECDSNGKLDESMRPQDYVELPEGPVELRVTAGPHSLQFSFRSAEGVEQEIGAVYDASRLSDEYAWDGDFSFTGTFVGLCCQDSLYGGIPADFDYFSYEEFFG